MVITLLSQRDDKDEEDDIDSTNKVVDKELSLALSTVQQIKNVF